MTGTRVVRALSYDEERTMFLSRGAWWTICPECNGSKIFEVTKTDTFACVYCKTKGLVPVAMEVEL